MRLCLSPLSSSSHSAHGGLFADSADRRALLPLVDWDERERAAASAHFRAQRAGAAGGGGALVVGGGDVSVSGGGGKQCSGASGERLQVGGDVDPALHSFVQRSWLPHRQHFDHYLAERLDVWGAAAQRDRQREERSRLTRRSSLGDETDGDAVGTERMRRISAATTGAAPFDRSKHAFTTSPAFEPL